MVVEKLGKGVNDMLLMLAMYSLPVDKGMY